MTDSVSSDRTPAAEADWRALPLLATILLLLIAVALVARAGPYTKTPAASTSTPTGTGARPQPPAEAPADPRGQAPEDFNEIPGVREVIPANVLVVAVTVLLVVLAAGAILVVLGAIPRPRFRRRRHHAGAVGAEDPVRHPGAEMAEAVDVALDLVDRGEAREAVLACWLLLIRTAAEAGSPARASETAREYAERLSAEQMISAGPLGRLAELYREARFSRHVVGPDLRAEARRALGVLQTELRSGMRL